jgi:hypothetical protein
MGYCQIKQKNMNVYIKTNNNVIQEIQDNKKKIKLDYESVKNIVMESNTKPIDIQTTKKQTKYIIN